jgi:hypothetical protein
MISGREFVIFLPSSSLRIYWQCYSGSRRDPSLPMTTMQSPGGRKLNDDTSAMQEWYMANAIDPPMVRKSDSRPPLADMFMTTIVSRETVVGGGGGGGGEPPPNGCSVPLASMSLWRNGSTHAYRGPVRMFVFKFILQ